MVLVNKVEAIKGQDLEQRLDGWYACYTQKEDGSKQIISYVSSEPMAKIFLLTYKNKHYEQVKYIPIKEYNIGDNKW